MLSGRRFLIAGLSRLTVRVAESLVAHHAEVAVIAGTEASADEDELAALLPDEVEVIAAGRDRDELLEHAGLRGATGFLALSEHDLTNVRFAADAHEVAPDVPIVLRTFQPELADHLSHSLNIRRAFSVAALSAPAFVAAAFSERVVETLRLADEEIPLCILDVHDGSPIVERTVAEVKTTTDCAIVAVQRDGAPWLPAESAAEALRRGDRVLAGGRHEDVLRLAARNETQAGRGWARGSRRRRRRRSIRHVTASLLPVSAAIFAVVFAATVIVNARVFDLDVTDAVSVALSAALGGSTPATGYEWVQVFNMASTVAGTILLWILLSHITAIVLAERLEARMTKRASRMRDHVVVVGLGKVGYRVVQLLAELDIPTVAIEEEPDSRFVDAVALHTPVLTGDGQLAENLERCGVDRARCIIACTNNDLANLASCLEARDLQPRIRTVSRVFDETLASRLSKAFQIDVVLSSTTIAATAFVGAAVDALAMRPIELAGLDVLAFRFVATAPMPVATIDQWRGKGLRVLAVRPHDGTAVQPPTAALQRPFTPGDEAVVVGPADIIRAFAHEFAAA